MRVRAPRHWLLVTTIVLAAAIGGVALADTLGSRNDDGERTPAPAHPTVPSTGAPHEPHPEPAPGRGAAERAAMHAARRFLTGYLPYSYGHAPASRIKATAAPLAATLRREPPRVPPAERRLRPRLIRLEVASSNGDLGLDLAASVDDGRRHYSLILAVRPDGDRWLVTALS